MTMTLGEKVRARRKELAMSMVALAEKIGAGKSYVWELENKGVKMPSAERLGKIAEALEVPIEYLMYEQEGEVEEEMEDLAFFRKYKQMNRETKAKIKKMIEIWDDE